MSDTYSALAWLFQRGSYVSGHIHLNVAHEDGSRESVKYPVRLRVQQDVRDPEEWARQSLAEVIESL